VVRAFGLYFEHVGFARYHQPLLAAHCNDTSRKVEIEAFGGARAPVAGWAGWEVRYATPRQLLTCICCLLMYHTPILTHIYGPNRTLSICKASCAPSSSLKLSTSIRARALAAIQFRNSTAVIMLIRSSCMPCASTLHEVRPDYTAMLSTTRPCNRCTMPTISISNAALYLSPHPPHPL
jgi:hypothetical protein